MRELEKIRKLQSKQGGENEQEFIPPQGSSIDFFADDEDLSIPKSALNVFLDSTYNLELVSIGFLFAFFSILRLLSSEEENAKKVKLIKKD